MGINSAAFISAGFYRSGALYKDTKQNTIGESAYAERMQERTQRVNNLKRMLNNAEKNQNKPKSIAEQTIEYGKSIRASRNKTKDTAAQLKQLKYNFKDISGQIRKSKTSVNAKQVASKARREVVQLKMKLQTGKYDTDELQAAITHAKAMERAAKKKARHLEEEELIKITYDSNGMATAASELETEIEDKMDEEYEASMEQPEAEREMELEAMEEAIIESVEENTDELYDMLSESMEEMMEDTLGDLAESMMVVTDFEMTREEFSTYKLKHRSSEEKAMLEADAKYLKAMFDMYDRQMNGGSDSGLGAGGDSSAMVFCAQDNFDTPNVVDVFI